jgi:hypothetical protein
LTEKSAKFVGKLGRRLATNITDWKYSADRTAALPSVEADEPEILTVELQGLDSPIDATEGLFAWSSHVDAPGRQVRLSSFYSPSAIAIRHLRTEESEEAWVGRTGATLRVTQHHHPLALQDYEKWKEVVQQARDVILKEMERQHQETRREIVLSRRDILNAVKSSPAEYVQVVSELGIAVCLFSLLLRWGLKIELINTPFAIFLSFSFAFYWLMAWLKKRA